jgi:hypothetical protein
MQTQRGGPDRVSMVETAPPKKRTGGIAAQSRLSADILIRSGD